MDQARFESDGRDHAARRRARKHACGSIACLALLVVASGSPSIANGTHVTIRVLNVSAAGGIVRVALCREVEWQQRNCFYGGHATATPGIVEVSVDVPPGVYGVLVHHDANGDNRVDKNIVGIPLEGVGFSRNARIRFGFPSFSSVCLPIAGDDATAAVTLLFEPLGVSAHER